MNGHIFSLWWCGHPSSVHPSRFAHITTRATVCMVPAGSPPPAPSFTSACTISRVTVSLALRVREAIILTCREWSSSEDSVRRILETFIRSTETNSSSWDSWSEELLLFLVKNNDFNRKLSPFELHNRFLYSFYTVCMCLQQRFKWWQSPLSSLPTAVLDPWLALQVHLKPLVMLTGMKSASSSFADIAASKVPLKAVTSTATP